MKLPNVLILGDVCLDEFLHGKVYGVAPEAAVPVLKVEKVEHRLGMAANVAVNLKELTGWENTELWSFFKKEGSKYNEFYDGIQYHCINGKHIESPLTLTIKQRGVVGTTYISRNDYETVKPISIINQLQQYKNELKKFDAIILSDYGKSVIGKPKELIKFLKQNAPEAKIFVDPDKNKDVSEYEGVYCIKANEKESLAITGEADTKEALMVMSEYCEEPIITLGEKGSMCLKNGSYEISYVNAIKCKAVDVVGAGDAFIAGLVFTICSGPEKNPNLIHALKTASYHAAKAVEKFGT